MDTKSGIYSVTITFQKEVFSLPNRYIKELYFIEDIFSFCINGKLIFIDFFGFTEFGPLTGEEKITITYGNENLIVKTFKIYKISDIEQYNVSGPTTNPVCQLFFVEDVNFLLTERQYSTSWKDKKITQIVEDISTGMLQLDRKSDFVIFEDGNEYLDYFYMPYWTPKKAIEWLMKRVSGGEFKNSGYLFYSNTKNLDETDTNKSYNFVTFEFLLNQKELLKLNDKDEGIYYFETPNANLYNKINYFTISGMDRTGITYLRGGRKYGFDNKEKIFLDTGEDLNYLNMINKTTVLGDSTLFSDISEPAITNVLESEETMEVLNNIYYDEWIKRYMHQNMVEIIVKGHEKRYAGAIIDINWPSLDSEKKFNLLYQGAYLIKSITHYFSANNPYYTQKMVLMKNGYDEIKDINSNIVPSVKKNFNDYKGKVS